MNELHQLSDQALRLLLQTRWIVDEHEREAPQCRPGEDPLHARLLDLAESMICLMDNMEFADDVQHLAYELRIDHESGDLRDLAALLRAAEEEIERALQHAEAEGGDSA